MTVFLRFFLLACLLILPACTQQTEALPTEPPPLRKEDPLAVQLKRVRRGKSTAIILESTPVTAEQFQKLADVADKLTRLEIDAATLTDENVALLSSFTQLDHLKLGAPVEDDALLQIAELKGLRILNLPNGQFTNDGLKKLAGMPKLQLLRISTPHVTDDGLAVLPKLPALRFVHLIGLPVTDASLKHLEKVETLESFYLDGGKATNAGLRRLLTARPDLHFHKDQLHLPGDPQAHDHGDGP